VEVRILQPLRHRLRRGVALALATGERDLEMRTAHFGEVPFRIELALEA
jgi:hypothetical protein